MIPTPVPGAPLMSTSQGGGLAPQPLGISLSLVGCVWILLLILPGTLMLRSQDTRTSSAVIKIPKYSASNKVSPSCPWLWKLSVGVGVGWPGVFGRSLPRLQPGSRRARDRSLLCHHAPPAAFDDPAQGKCTGVPPAHCALAPEPPQPPPPLNFTLHFSKGTTVTGSVHSPHIFTVSHLNFTPNRTH